MVHIFVDFFIAIVAFLAGAYAGITNTPALDKALTVIKQAEADAQAVLNKINPPAKTS